MGQHKEGSWKVQVNTQQSGGTGRSSLWIVCWQSLHPGSGRNSGLRICSNSAGGSVCSVVDFALRKETTVPKFKNKKCPAPELLLHPDKFFHSPGPDLGNLESTPRLHWKTSAPASVEHCSETLMFCHRISSFEFQLVFSPSFLLQKAPITTVLRFFWGTSRFNYKRPKRPTHFLQNSHFSGIEIICLCPLREQSIDFFSHICIK